MFAAHGNYLIKYYGEWITATLCSDDSVKEKYFTAPDGMIIMQFEVEDIINLPSPYIQQKPVLFAENRLCIIEPVCHLR